MWNKEICESLRDLERRAGLLRGGLSSMRLDDKTRSKITFQLGEIKQSFEKLVTKFEDLRPRPNS